MSSMKSIRYPVSIHKGMRRVAQEPDYAEYVEQLIRQVLLTSPGERINRPDFGCGLRQMVFAPLYEITGSLTKVMVLEALERWLGDVISVEDVGVTTGDEILEVRIAYVLRSRRERRYLNLEVTL